MGVSGTCSSETMTRATDSSTEQNLVVGCSEAQSAEACDRKREPWRFEAMTGLSDANPAGGGLSEVRNSAVNGVPERG